LHTLTKPDGGKSFICIHIAKQGGGVSSFAKCVNCRMGWYFAKANKINRLESQWEAGGPQTRPYIINKVHRSLSAGCGGDFAAELIEEIEDEFYFVDGSGVDGTGRF
jgi:hypothetical protein